MTATTLVVLKCDGTKCENLLEIVKNSTSTKTNTINVNTSSFQEYYKNTLIIREVNFFTPEEYISYFNEFLVIFNELHDSVSRPY